MRILESKGLVEITTHVGAKVVELQPNEYDELYRIRERVEPLMLRLSIPNFKPEIKKEFSILISKAEKASTVEEFLKYDREFHLLTYQGAQTKYLGNLIERMWNTTQPYRRAYTQKLEPEHFQSAHLEHLLLLNAINRNDLDEAERVLYGHIRRTRIELSRHFDLNSEYYLLTLRNNFFLLK